MMNKLVIIGAGAFAEIAFEYFLDGSVYTPVAFSVERAYCKQDSLFGLPVIPFEDLETRYPPESTHFFVAIVYTQGNNLRARLYQWAKEKGFAPASYVSPHGFKWRNFEMGEHCFVFEGNTLQPFSRMGDDNILWSGNHIGHHTTIGNHCFISSHVVISGHCKIGDYCFLGVNSTITDHITIGNHCTIGAGALVLKDVPDNAVVKGVWK